MNSVLKKKIEEEYCWDSCCDCRLAHAMAKGEKEIYNELIEKLKINLTHPVSV